MTFADAGQPGLYAQARRGKVRFLFRYRKPGGGVRRHVQLDFYGAITLDQARTAAQTLRGQVANAKDPQVERDRARREGTSVADAVSGYLADLEERAAKGARRGKRSGAASARRLLERHVLPALGSKRLRDVSSEDVRRLHRGMSKTPGEANRTLTALAAVFGHADRAELIPAGTNPTRHVERYREEGRRRALSPDELRALGAALNKAEAAGTVHSSAVLAVYVLALTGMRRSELLGHGMKDRRGVREGLRWGDIDLAAGVVHLHDTKTGRQKRALGAAAIALLRAAKPQGATAHDCVCPGAAQGAPFIGLDKVRVKLWRAAGIVATADGRADLHSLRHSFASVGAHVQGGRYVGMVSALLGHGHQAKAVTERYISADPEALRPAADAIAAEIARLLGLGEPASVLAFPKGKQ